MAKTSPDWVKDAKLDAIADNCNKLILCEGAPADYTEATTLKSGGGKKLGEVTLTTGDGNGDYAIADNEGTGAGRKLTISQKSGITPNEAGDWDHVALIDTTNSLLGPVTSKTSQAITTSTDVTVNAWAIRDKDPV